MKNISIREAVKQFQVSRPTLTKALNSDKVSGQKDDNGTWMMDPSEVAWVYKPRLPSPDKEQADDALLEALKSQIEDLKARLDKSEDARAATATQFTAFLTDQRKRLNAEIEEDLYRKDAKHSHMPDYSVRLDDDGNVHFYSIKKPLRNRL